MSSARGCFRLIVKPVASLSVNQKEPMSCFGVRVMAGTASGEEKGSVKVMRMV